MPEPSQPSNAAPSSTVAAQAAHLLLSAHCDIVWSTKTFGQFDADQPSWRAFTGQTEAELLGRGWVNALHPDDRNLPYVMPSHLTSVFEAEYRLRHVSGSYRNMLVRMLPVLAPDGSIVEWLGSHCDVTQQRQTEQRLRLAMQGGRMGTWEIDLGSGSMAGSDAFKANLGLPPDSRIDYAQLTGAMLDGDLQHWQTVVHAAIASASDFEIDIRVRWPDGSLHWAHMRGTCASDGAGNVIALSGISLDLTTSKQNEETLRLTLAAGEVATWNWDIVADRVTADSNLARLFPVNADAATAAPLARYLDIIHPDDREQVSAQIAQALHAHAPFEASYRVAAGDGQYRSVIARGRAEYAPDGTPLQFPGVLLDITRQKQVEDALRRSEERYRTLIELMDQAFCVIEMLYDEQGRPVDFRYLEGNAAFVKQSGLDNAIGKTIRSFVPDHDQHWFDLYDQVVKTGEPVRYENEAVAMERWFEVFAARLGGPGSRLLTVLFSDISERKRSEQQLRQLADNLSEMDRRKTEFLATLAHELRNPLAPIRNGLQIMRLAADKPATVARVRDVMERQVNQMVHLVNDLLDVARITRGQIELKLERADLKTIIAGAVETSMPLIEAGRHQLQVQLAEEALLLEADPTRLAQVLGNLLNNTAKYTPAGGHISLRALRDGNEALIEVKDSGVGIPAESLATVFDMFTQVGQNMGRAQGGLGIGLSLVRRLAELHGGSATAASPGAGLGSTFSVRLPLLEEEAKAPAVLAAPANTTGGPHFRVLVVDDNVDAAETLAAVLDMMGHAAQVAHDGAQALALVPQFLPDVIFLDIGLPGMSGYEVARTLRRIPAGANVVLVALTGWGAENDRSQSSAAGFDHHLTKPANLLAIGELLAALSTPNTPTNHD
ncbi:PAS domain-containing hybrid sensor histidine kinase/response regulator [Janthinobacterium lividum]|uniref:hybrid sensor histidine kinase/response regulator n=1 Tax=Janthinobacterium lividum TaxID=29581 RepID=UPI0008756D4E|nr:PAS domain-containing hybrid sensor histidine kinase/response regulator [Janthinobacterium lividum]MCC7714639.1 PAS domain-containing protein [Janthinobacterium lividum]OEZ56108.1 aerobic respiration control sensor protein ArcB [Janthinobacterium lividum]WQE30161.1 PAS domain-containing protein [Janthinobacterium lividum]STQ95659.1 Aerobic respiration control sensor protein ArcB [Janthinobacterium lividum]